MHREAYEQLASFAITVNTKDVSHSQNITVTVCNKHVQAVLHHTILVFLNAVISLPKQHEVC